MLVPLYISSPKVAASDGRHKISTFQDYLLSWIWYFEVMKKIQILKFNSISKT